LREGTTKESINGRSFLCSRVPSLSVTLLLFLTNRR
jgi:hypothetical protein